MAGTADTAADRPAPSGRAPLDRLSVELFPDTQRIELVPQYAGVSPDSLGMLWHRVHPQRGFRLALESSDSRHRIVRMSVRGGPGWKNRWVKWNFPVRQARDLQGGDALEAKDVLTQNDSVLTLLVAAGETRFANLEIVPTLDGETDAGTRAIEVLVEDITDGEAKSSTFVLDALLKFEHPRSDFIAMLPGIYQEAMDEQRRDSDDPSYPPFFERFLLGFEDAYEPLRLTMAHLDSLFGPFSTPPEFLTWLAAWVCMPLNENWPEMKRRRLVREAVELWRWRGTKKGLSRYLQIYTGVEPEIDDQPVEGMRLGPDSKLGEIKLGDIPPHTFVVNIAVPDLESINEEIVHDIISYEKPAHTAYALRIVRKTPS